MSTFRLMANRKTPPFFKIPFPVAVSCLTPSIRYPPEAAGINTPLTPGLAEDFLFNSFTSKDVWLALGQL